MTTRSLVVPIYRNAENIPTLIAALETLWRDLDQDLEVVFVVDGSPDESGRLLLEAECRFPCKVVFHSRNFGAFAAIRTGMEKASGEYVAAMAADLQEPPELVLQFFTILGADEADVVFGERMARSDPPVRKFLSNVFWGFYRRFVIPAIPKGGVDIFGCNRKVVDSILSIEERNSSLVAQLFWVGYRRRFVSYARRAREHGTSAWNLSRRFRYMMDSIFSFSDLPILVVLWLGALGTIFSILVGVVTVVSWALGYVREPGYTTLVVLMALFASLGFLVQGILGCYLWRALENTKRRPLRIISHIVERPAS
ncbi:glycosyltransferase family 2 protein [Consotaella salsifontis]|uniref:Glycosyltransferase involved in cell wall bisynthesis n=1 Tax=Consotaella salsifontis TaxID=1365950 RepID=A0A1T4P1X3_9HYPH|nr:glycosyltransferase family 2 protein [Consotaella salsifontis]SJZ85459.1 Glycosyltransferase involved in cell wall bisynthesis [Consotaella salsifontis]